MDEADKDSVKVTSRLESFTPVHYSRIDFSYQAIEPSTGYIEGLSAGECLALE
jgi:hypothetical protein